MLKITVNHRQVDLAIKKVRSNIELRRPLLKMIGAKLVGYTRQTIAMQGRGKAWAPLAPSTKKVTGRDKALITLIPAIKHRVNNRAGVTVYFAGRPSGWSIDMHERGFRSKAVKGKVMKVVRLGIFSSRVESVIPARKIFPTLAEIRSIAGPITNDWVRSIIRTNWK